MVLIHSALLCEAQSIIEKLKLKKTNSNPKIYQNGDFIVLIGGIGRDNTIRSLQFVFNNFKIERAFNIGVAGCSDRSIDIGTIFCTNHKGCGVDHIPLSTVDEPQVEKGGDVRLYDMEGKYFQDTALGYLEAEDIYIFKIVSDHLDDTVQSKEFIKSLIYKNIDQLVHRFQVV